MKFISSLASQFRKAAGDPHSEMIHVNGIGFFIEKCVGEGAFSKVYLCHPESSATLPSRVAIKRTTLPVEQKGQIKRQVELQKIAVHNNIVRCFECEALFKSGSVTIISVMEYCPSSVIHRMKEMRKAGKHFTESEVVHIVSSVCLALQFLHSLDPPVAHRDLKAENILISENGEFKLCDFSSATNVAYRCRSAQDVAEASADIAVNTTLIYRSPEMVDPWRKQRIDEKADIWALGVLLYYLMYFQFPFEETTLAILNASITFPPTPSYSDQMKQIVAKCLVHDPDLRSDILGILSYLAAQGLGISSDVLKNVPNRIALQPVVSPSSPCDNRVEEVPKRTEDAPPALFSMLNWGSEEDGGSTATANPSQELSSAQRALPNSNERADGGHGGPTDLFSTLNWSESAKEAEAQPRSHNQKSLDEIFEPPVPHSSVDVVGTDSKREPSLDLFAQWEPQKL